MRSLRRRPASALPLSRTARRAAPQPLFPLPRREEQRSVDLVGVAVTGENTRGSLQLGSTCLYQTIFFSLLMFAMLSQSDRNITIGVNVPVSKFNQIWILFRAVLIYISKSSFDLYFQEQF
ncbi:hypothetical protein VPH35_122501 [Triticum aestivum]